MSFKSSSLLCIAFLLAFSSAVYGFDITKMLEKEPELSSFNKYITEAKLADQINSRNTITVLAVGNDAISSIAGKSPELIKAIISTHVILDYYDEKKLVEAQASTPQLTTLFQSSGNAVKEQGFVKVSLIGEGEIAFSSVGSSDYSELVKPIASEPYNISILQVTKPIIPPGLDSQTAQSPQQAKASPPTSSKTAKAPAPSKTANSPSPAKSSEAPAPSYTAAAPSPSETVAESPLGSSDAPATAAEGPAADDGDAASDSSSSSTVKMGLVAVMAFASLFIVS